MRSFRFNVVLVVALSALFGGCTANSQCPRPLGSFVGQYTAVSGNCTSIMGRTLLFDAERETSSINTLDTLSDSVTTEVNLIGCTVTVEQSISDSSKTRMIAKIEGDLDVMDENALSGTLAYQEFLPDGTTQACASTVQVNYVKQGAAAGVTATGNVTTFGAAAEAALSQP
jgi:hypothetical protein